MVNFMKIKTLIATTLLCLSFHAAAEDRVTSMAYEIALSDFGAPATANGGASFKQCSDCDRKVVRVTSSTRYSVNDKSVRLEDFRKAILQAEDRDKTPVIVLHHLESNTIVSLSVSI